MQLPPPQIRSETKTWDWIKMISPEFLVQYLKIGLIPVPLNELSTRAMIHWGEIYNNPNFWSIKKLACQTDKFYNVATTFGETPLKDSVGRKLFLHCLDIDSEGVLEKVIRILEEWKTKTFVTKTQKDCGYHIYWFERSDHKATHTEYCKKGFEFEIKCGKALCTLPPSRHRDNPFFHYQNVGQPDRIMVADGLYQQLLKDILADCIKRSKKQAPKDGNYGNKSSDSSNTRVFTADDSSKLDSYPTSNRIDKKIILTAEETEESVQCLITYYKEKTRHLFAFGLGGLCFKESH